VLYPYGFDLQQKGLKPFARVVKDQSSVHNLAGDSSHQRVVGVLADIDSYHQVILGTANLFAQLLKLFEPLFFFVP
jgi:hypothetical protein